MFLLNSRLGHFSAAPSCSIKQLDLIPNCQYHTSGAPLLPKLRGQFAEFLNEGSLARLRILSPPTCVGLRYGHLNPSLEAFLDSMGSATSLLVFAPRHPSGSVQGGFACLAPYRLGRTQPTVRLAYPPVSPLPQTVFRWHRILNRLSFAYALRPRLRSRLTLGGRAFPRKP